MKRALEGIRVVDLSHVLAAPTCTMFLADLGAEVIHIEPPHGDDSREFGPFAGDHDKNRSGYFISLNRNKKSMVLNLKHQKGKEILRELIKVSDVLVENFRPTTMRKLGFGWKEIQEINPRLVYASISGFGQDTLPGYDTRPAYDMVAQGYSGIMSITGPEGGPPCRVGSSVGNIFAGHQAVIGIIAALFAREKTGRGQHHDGAMVDGLFCVLENAVARYTLEGTVPGPLGSAHPSITPFQGFETKDSWIITPIGNDSLWKTFCSVLERDDLTDDPRFATNPLRTEHKDELIPILAIELKKKTSQEWSDLFEAAGLPYSPINTMKDICEDPHISYRKMLVEIEQPRVGTMKIAGSPIHLSETPGEVYAPAPLLGEHTEEVLRTILSYTDDEIQELKDQGVINTTV
ncbi:MAG: CoA transferase [Deltaproteobacteria bacterium]|nr:CoA transferase [Deltaproteobacteria bacterium]MBN2687758.1 CoA transferase [Deltaproteobacteria bacterium]